MNKQRMSRNAEKRVASFEVQTRGRASLSRSAQLDREVPLTGRRFRRANRLTHAEAARLDVLVRQPDGSAIRPTLSVVMDAYTRTILGFNVS